MTFVQLCCRATGSFRGLTPRAFSSDPQVAPTYTPPVAGAPGFDETFATLRALLRRQGKQLQIVVDTPGDFQVASPTMRDRIGRPLFVAGVQKRKNYVSLHLMPIYMDPSLLEGISPGLRKRLQGKACFNFKAIEAEHLDELNRLVKEGFERFKTIELPWGSGADRRRR